MFPLYAMIYDDDINATLEDPGQDYEAPGQDSGDAFSSVCSCVVFIKALYVSTASERKDSSTIYLPCVVTAASL